MRAGGESTADAARRHLQTTRAAYTPTSGCTDPAALTFDSLATQHVQSSCTYAVNGCTDSIATNYLAAANTNDGSCTFSVSGCTSQTALNYDTAANSNDGSCRFTILGCTDSVAVNYVSAANTDSGTCRYPRYGCMSATNTLNFDSTADANAGCRYQYAGCMDSTAANFNPTANVEAVPNVCEFYIPGCLAPAALNFNSLATRDDSTCVFPITGCMDSLYSDYRCAPPNGRRREAPRHTAPREGAPREHFCCHTAALLPFSHTIQELPFRSCHSGAGGWIERGWIGPSPHLGLAT